MLKTFHFHNLAKEKEKWELYNPFFAFFKVNIIKLTINYHNRQFMSYKVQYIYIQIGALNVFRVLLFNFYL